ncbi:MAG: hypothetical protein GY827_05415 [Cytophagales bacterium]|nr:hypothetical protein [Cytophagales bacterium]
MLSINRNVKYALSIIGILVILGFTEYRKSQRICSKITVNIQNADEGVFLEEEDIVEMVDGNFSIKRSATEKIKLKSVEEELKRNKFVGEAQVHTGISGNVLIEIKQSRPIARIVKRDSSFYIGSNGEVLPFITKHTARVVVVSGKGMQKLFVGKERSTLDSSFVQFLQYLEQDVFFKSQIASVEYLKNGEMFLYPQITKQRIDFGDLTDIEGKFNRLMVFYKKILPNRGWNHYEEVCVKYKKQVVCR